MKLISLTYCNLYLTVTFKFTTAFMQHPTSKPVHTHKYPMWISYVSFSIHIRRCHEEQIKSILEQNNSNINSGDI